MDLFDLTPLRSVLLAIDVQDRFQSAIPSIAADQPVGKAIGTLAQGCQLLGLNSWITEQYPKGLGHTLPWLREALPHATVREKTHFSCADDPDLRTTFSEDTNTHVIVCGIEAHVCVLSTVADLIDLGKWVVVAADAVDSRSPQHRQWALDACRDLGALVLPVESILFRLQRQAGVGAFKQISALVR